jgi:hypothetical protein
MTSLFVLGRWLSETPLVGCQQGSRFVARLSFSGFLLARLAERRAAA